MHCSGSCELGCPILLVILDDDEVIYLKELPTLIPAPSSALWLLHIHSPASRPASQSPVPTLAEIQTQRLAHPHFY